MIQKIMIKKSDRERKDIDKDYKENLKIQIYRQRNNKKDIIISKSNKEHKRL